MKKANYNFFIQWHVTERCNLKCRHCYQERINSELNYNDVCQAIRDISRTIKYWVSEYGLEISPSIHFTGGEPLLYNGLSSVINFASKLKFSVSLMTNGTLITKNNARILKSLNIIDVQVSLDGMEVVHDSIRGKGAFKRAIKGIEHLVSYGIDTSVNLTISRLNMSQIEDLVHLAETLNINAVTFSRLVPCGRGSTLLKHMLTPQELASIYNNLHNVMKSSKVSVISRDPLLNVANLSVNLSDIDFPVGGCAAGMFGITIKCNGDIMPCRRMDNIIIGNIKEQSLKRIWAESEVLWSLRSRESYHGNCRDCIYWAICRGCRAIALAVSRLSGGDDYMADDPQCPYYKKF